MFKLFSDTRLLDAACRKSYGLTEEIMMENAAAALEKTILENIKTDAEKINVVILCGRGNNGADGYALARRLNSRMMNVDVIQCGEPSSPLCQFQSETAARTGVEFKEMGLSYQKLLENADFVADCVFGSGFHGELDKKIQKLMKAVNSLKAVKVACDISSGIDAEGHVSEGTFCADVTVTMGALKMGLYSDAAKDYTGKIVVANLGVTRELFENPSGIEVKEAACILEENENINLPHRKNCVNKGSFGHAVIAAGEKTGAALIAGSAALRSGAGLVTLVSSEKIDVPMELMNSSEVPQNCTAVAFGMGLGRNSKALDEWFDFVLSHKDIPCVIDADAFYSEKIRSVLGKRPSNVVLTPHPKEFQSLLKICGFGEYSVSECVSKRPELIEKFCRKYPGAVLLVKGANPVIGFFRKDSMNLIINPLGKPCLAKAGSGDVLSGVICALMAQKTEDKEHFYKYAVTGSWMHAMASRKIKCDYSMTPSNLIKAIAELGEE